LYSISKEEALNLHKAMWSGMQKKYGNNCSGRRGLKQEWLRLNLGLGPDSPSDVKSFCFLCEYAYQQIQADDWANHLCHYCPIDWRPERVKEIEPDGASYACESFRETCWQSAPISTILNLPERKIEE